MPPVDKIKRNFLWLRRVLRIIDKTTLPGKVEDRVRVAMDLFGWERLTESIAIETSAPAPNTAVDGPLFTDEESIRLILNASGRHTDTGVTHNVWITKTGIRGGVVSVAVPVDRPTLVVGERCALIGQTYLKAGERLTFNVTIPLVVGAVAFVTEFIDLPIGEYIQPLKG